MMKYGSELRKSEQAFVVHAYTGRFTKEHRPSWSSRPDCSECPVQFETDEEWLENTKFHVKNSGQLDSRYQQCESNPTWPDNPELR